MNKLLILIRGVPGSGKSTLARMLEHGHNEHGYGAVHYEADMFFTDRATNEYRYDPTKIKDAHQWCQDSVRNCMKDGVATIIVSNTFTRKWEMNNYIKMAGLYSYKVQTIVCEAYFNNVHGVPAEKVQEMRNRFEY